MYVLCVQHINYTFISVHASTEYMCWIISASQFHEPHLHLSSVDIATDYGLDGPRSNPGGDEIFRLSRLALGAHPASCKMGTESFPGVKCGRGVLLTTHPLLVPRSWKNRAIPLTGSLYLIYKYISIQVLISESWMIGCCCIMNWSGYGRKEW